MQNVSGDNVTQDVCLIRDNVFRRPGIIQI